MNWFFIALIGPAIWGVISHIDKFLLSRYFKGGGTGSLLIFSSLIGFLVLPLILFFESDVFAISQIKALLICANGFLYILGMIPYLYALKKDETSVVAALWWLSPIYSYFLGYFFLNENLGGRQIMASFLILAGAIGISLDLKSKKAKFKKDVFGLMALAGFIWSLNVFFFKFFAIQEKFWVVNFWQYLGFTVAALFLLLFVKSYRKQFLSVMRTNRIPVIGLNTLNEVINVVALVATNFASLIAPVALVMVVGALHPFFVLIYGVILALFFPSLTEESMGRRLLIQKTSAVIVMFIGVYLLSVGSF
jgi:drug/metabolite transporter (DMT)-like permease